MTVSQQFTVGKLDAGLAILLSPAHHVVEFPSTILPEGIVTGSIVNVTIERNEEEEARQLAAFLALQQEIIDTFGRVPEPPVLAVKAVTQTSVTLQWEPLRVYTADVRSMAIYRNTTKLSLAIPRDAETAKVSGLDLDTKYDFTLVVKTSAGALTSNLITVRTKTIEDLSSLHICFGDVPDSQELKALQDLVTNQLKAEYSAELSADTTHFVCKVGRGLWAAARDANVPIVNPDFLKACVTAGKLQPAGKYYVPEHRDE